jgi:hypothetical protein
MASDTAVLNAEQADALGERVREVVLLNARETTGYVTTWHAADLRDLDRWLRALHRAHEGLQRHDGMHRCAPDGTWHRASDDGPLPRVCRDLPGYTDAAADASDALRDLAAMYGAEVPDA